MPGAQEIIAIGIVLLVAGRLIWKRWSKRTPGNPAAKSGACGDCNAAAPPAREATVHFYRRRNSGDTTQDKPGQAKPGGDS